MWILYTTVFGYDVCNSTDILCIILWLSPHPWDAPVSGYMEVNEWMNECTKHNFPASSVLKVHQYDLTINWDSKVSMVGQQ